MNIKIITDTACDLPKELLQKYDIEVLPLHISRGDRSYLDMIEITPADIFQHVNSGGDICTTAAVNIAEFTACFERYSPDYDALIVITIGSGFSSCYQNARIAAEEFPNVFVIDSCNLSSGQGFVVLEASKMAKSRMDVEELCSYLERVVPRVEASFVLDSLDYMKKGGRCSAILAFGANRLKIKPCITVKDGQMKIVKKYRGDYPKVIYHFTKELLENCRDVCEDLVLLPNPAVEPAAMEAARKAIAEDGRFDTVMEAPTACTVACHCGPNTLGVMFLKRQ
ncbi:MAG: DegV family protein [Lachnospiraceae bacterium]